MRNFSIYSEKSDFTNRSAQLRGNRGLLLRRYPPRVPGVTLPAPYGYRLAQRPRGYGGYGGYVRAARSGPGKPLPSLRSSGRRPVAALISGATAATARPGRHPCATATAQGPSTTATAQGPAASGVPARRGDGVRGPTGPPGALPRSRRPCLPCTLKFCPFVDNSP